MQTLPIHAYQEAIERAVREHEAVIIAAETGAGKSTQVPIMLRRAGFGSQGMIGITQPRRVAAMSVASFVAECMGSELGKEVGYQIRHERRLSGETRIKFMTEGILLRELHGDPELRRYEIIILDEAHERGINMDLCLALLHKVRRLRPDLKIIVMSATIDEERFAKHFAAADGTPAPIIKVPGRVFPVETQYLEKTPFAGQLPEVIADQVDAIAKSGKPGDVLVFLPDEVAIKKTCAAIDKRGTPGLSVLPLYGQQAPDEQREVFKRCPERRVIVSTNIAETSITVDGVVWVLDSGLIKGMQYVSASLSALRVQEHSKAGCDQRAGRAGRTQPGICVRLFERADWSDRPAYTEPELKRTTLDAVLLHLRALDYSMEDIKTMEFMDPPGDERWDEAEGRLKLLGAIDKTGKVTEDGRRMERLPVSPVFGRMLLSAERYGCVEEIATVVSAMTARSVFVRPRGKEEESKAAHWRFLVNSSDALTVLKVFDAWEKAGENGRRNQWASENFVSSRALREIERNREQLLNILAEDGVVPSSSRDEALIRKAVAAGLIVNLCVKQGRYEYEGAGYFGIYIFPGSALFGSGPKMMVAGTIYESTTERGTRTYARDCTTIDAAWLDELVPLNACEVRVEIESPFISFGDEPSLALVLSWQGTEIKRRLITEEELVALLPTEQAELIREQLAERKRRAAEYAAHRTAWQEKWESERRSDHASRVARRDRDDAEKAEKVELGKLGRTEMLACQPNCPLCGGSWQTETDWQLVCHENHNPDRIVRLDETSSSDELGTFLTNRDEWLGTLRFERGVISLTFSLKSGDAWAGKKFKEVRYVPRVVILPDALVAEREEILRDLADLRQAREELEALTARLREAETRVGGGAMKRLTFKIEGGQAVAHEGGRKYSSAYQDPYPQEGEVWFCRIGRDQLGVTQVHPEFKAGSISSARDLEELRNLLRETYPGLPEQLLFVQ